VRSESVGSAEARPARVAESAFRREHPDYADTAVLDELRATDFGRLDRTGHVYLDYTGGGLFASSQLADHMELLESSVLGNPHSINPTSAASSELVERARGYVLDFFAASAEDYVAIFTPNEMGALRLVGEAFPFGSGDRFLLTGEWLIQELASIRHTNGAPATTIYGPRSWQRRGATVAFNFLHPDGRVIDERYVARVAAQHRLSLRTGCFCNPGAGEVAFTISRETLLGGEFGESMTLDDYVDAIGLPSGGAIRASFGLVSNFDDVHRMITFARCFIDLDEVASDLPPRVGC
jgi:selenocysteine lyase/cysteine desulfurase